MNTRRVPSLLHSLPVQGAIVGFCATQALDVVSTAIYEREGRRARFVENATRGGLHAYERAIARMGRTLGLGLSRGQAKTWGWRFHKTFGLLGGVGYVALRRRWPRLGRWGGLAFGAAFFAIADELMMPLLGLTPGPRKFSWKVHARGAIAHVFYGVAAETATRVLESGAFARSNDGTSRRDGSSGDGPEGKGLAATRLEEALEAERATMPGLPDSGRLA